MADVSSTRLYLGGLPRNVTKQDIEKHFEPHGTGKITEIKLMNGFGFLEYEDAMDARDVVPAFHGSEMNGSRITVQFARGARHKENFSGPADRAAPRPRRTIYRMVIEGLAPETSWQDLKDFARDGASVDVVYSETDRARDGKGFVEFETKDDLKAAVDKLDGRDYKGGPVVCREDIQDERPDSNRSYRQRSPPARRGYPPTNGYDRPPPRDYGYRERSPGPPRGRYDDYPPPRDYRGRTPPPRDPYGPPPRDPYRDPYREPLPPRAYPPEPYPPNYSRPRSPPRADYDYRGGYGGGYPERRY